MKTKNWFVALVLLISTASWATTVTETITPAKLIDAGAALSDGSATSFSNVSVDVPTVKYAGNLGYDKGKGAFYLTKNNCLSVTSSNYKALSITVTWSTGNVNGLKNGLNTYYRDAAFSGSETNDVLKNIKGLPKQNVGYASAGSTSSADLDIIVAEDTTHVKFYSLVGKGTAKNYISQIVIEWETISAFDVVIGSHTNGTIEINGSTTPDLIEAGADVTMTLTPDVGYELTGYTIGASVINLTPAERTTEPVEVHFDMPAEDVTVSAVFADALARHTSNVYIADGEYSEIVTSAGYPLSINISTSEEYILVVEDVTDEDYCVGSPASFSQSWQTGGIASVSSLTYAYDDEMGAYLGAITIQGLAMGTDKLTLTFKQTDDYVTSSVDIYVHVIVPTHTAALVAEVDGRYYAVTTTLSAGKLGAEEVIVANGKVFYDSDLINAADITWVIAESRDAYGDPIYTIQNAESKYLDRYGSTDFRFADGQVTWSDADGTFVISGKSICYVSGHFEASTSSTGRALEITTISAMPAAIERSQPNGKLSTMCFPFSINLESPFVEGIGTVYNVSGVYKSGDKVTGIGLSEEASTILEAGKPYVFEASASDLYVQYGEFTVAGDRGYATGLVGNLTSSKIYVPDDGYCYGISNNVIRRVLPGATASIGAYKAYINVDGLDEVGASPAPGRRVIYVENTATSLEDILDGATFINWNEPVYNMLGQQVGKGTTGVLIQNGQKFFVH